MRWWKLVSSTLALLLAAGLALLLGPLLPSGMALECYGVLFGPPPIVYSFLIVCVALFGMLLSGGAIALPRLGPWLGRWGPRLVTGAALLLLGAFILYRLEEGNSSVLLPGGRSRTGNDHGKCPRLHIRYCAIAAVALWGAAVPLFVSRLRAWQRARASEPLRWPLIALFSASGVCLFFLWHVGALDNFATLPSEEEWQYLALLLHRLFKA
jgi:hypothetical protein